MPDASVLLDFLQELEVKLATPIDTYFDVVDAAIVPVSGFSGLLQGITARLDLMRARNVLGNSLRQILGDAQVVAGVLGNNGQTLSDRQYTEVQQAIGEQMGYLSNFLSQIDSLGRGQAITRIQKYVAAVFQTISRVAALGLPELPHRPGDRDLACKGYCKCHLDVQGRGPGAWDVYWVLDYDAEHCLDCLRLSEVWNPLLIRDGVILSERQVA